MRMMAQDRRDYGICMLMPHLYQMLWHLVIMYNVPVSYSDGNPTDLAHSGILVTGDVLIGAVIPLHIDKLYPKVTFQEEPPADVCTMFLLEHYQQFQAMRYAVDEINQSPSLLPNITLGFYAYDSCAVMQRELEGTLWMLTGHDRVIPNYCCRDSPPLAAVIGHSASTYSILMAHILGLYRYPQISYFSTSSLLSDRTKFPSFFRTVPSDAFQSQGLAQMVMHFGWTWVGLVAADNDYGQDGIKIIKQEIAKSGACVAFTKYIQTARSHKNILEVAKAIKTSTAKVVVLFSTDVYLIPLFVELLALNATGKVFVASEAWSISNVLSIDKYSSILLGTIGFSYHSSKIQDFQHYLNSIDPYNTPGPSWANIFWEEAFGCTLPSQKNVNGSRNALNVCTGEEDLNSIHNLYNDVSSLRTAYNVYTAVYIIAKALDDLTLCKDEEGSLLRGKCRVIEKFKTWQLLHYFKKVRVELSDKRKVFFDENGDPPAAYDVVNWQKNQKGAMVQMKVGNYDTVASSGETFSINTSSVCWPDGKQEIPISVCSVSCLPGFRKAPRRGEPICCFECVPCPQGEISNDTDAIDCSKCPWDMWPNAEKDQCLPKPIEYLSYSEPLGITLMTTSLSSSMVPVFIFKLFLRYRTTPIVRANNYSVSCILLLSLSLFFLCSLTFIGYPETEKCLLRQAAFGMAFALCVSCILAKTLMVVFAFMATRPGSSLKRWTSPHVSYMVIATSSLLQFLLCIGWVVAAPPFPQYNTETQPGIIIVECNENSPTAFWSMLGYLGLLAIISFVVAFMARGLPDNFNEAKFITFSMLAFLSVWISYIPASLSSKGKYTVAMEIFAIQTSSWALVICMFLPKCFIILFRPEMNSKEHIMGKDKGRK
ncbi:PREDICTED: extracellular calcium-sensing receptor-like [Nanorana parkeri]|uniref:extracellular calcium-sensing receptor-like n=1 Tax=Nanorana parkeri TaxID=125878 RepID=UPI000854CD87|nr:PREDICTED: extracellular calcium-sensing receptor-like [Nanorana parkeri]